MKRAERWGVLQTLVLLLASLFLLAQAWLEARFDRRPARDVVLADGCRAPIRILEGHYPKPRPGVVVFHGLSSNRRVMQSIGTVMARNGPDVYLVDLPGHGDNAEPFSFPRAEECAAEIVTTLERRGQIRLDRTVLVGHSMGGAIVVRLADRFPTAATVAISTALMRPPEGRGKPAPLELPRRMPVNLLVVVAEYDLPQLKERAQQLIRAAGGERYRDADFRQRRAVRLVNLSASHTSVLFTPELSQHLQTWLNQSLPGSTSTLFTELLPGLVPAGLGLLGSLLVFPLAATGVTRLLRAKGNDAAPSAPGIVGLLVRWAVAGLGVAGLLALGVPLRSLVRIYTGDYLASFLFLAGLLLLALMWKTKGPGWDLRSFRPVAAGGLLGLLAMLVLGAWLDWRFADVWLNAPRWWRFAVLVPLLLPYALAEEAALGPLPPGKKEDRGAAAEAAPRRRWARLGVFLLLRLILWLALLFALFALSSGQVLVLLLAFYLAVFSLVQRLGADAVRRRTGSALAASVFSAILAAWFIAAVFPIV